MTEALENDPKLKVKMALWDVMEYKNNWKAYKFPSKGAKTRSRLRKQRPAPDNKGYEYRYHPGWGIWIEQKIINGQSSLFTRGKYIQGYQNKFFVGEMPKKRR